MVLVLACGILSQSPTAARAWGRIGHRAAAKLAESQLSPAARTAVRQLLEPGESLADASTWADEHRREWPETGPWHYVNVPIQNAHFDMKFCPESGCVVSRIGAMQRILTDPKASRSQKQFALRMLVHLVEDLHQPVHVGDRHDRGGNDLQVRFFGQGSNLHRVWDSGLIERHNPDESAWVAELKTAATPENLARWSNGRVEDWADESLQAAKRAYRVPGQTVELQPGARLGEAYLTTHLPTVRTRLAQSGTRLAWILNETFPH